MNTNRRTFVQGLLALTGLVALPALADGKAPSNPAAKRARQLAMAHNFSMPEARAYMIAGGPAQGKTQTLQALARAWHAQDPEKNRTCVVSDEHSAGFWILPGVGEFVKMTPGHCGDQPARLAAHRLTQAGYRVLILADYRWGYTNGTSLEVDYARNSLRERWCQDLARTAGCPVVGIQTDLRRHQEECGSAATLYHKGALTEEAYRTVLFGPDIRVTCSPKSVITATQRGLLVQHLISTDPIEQLIYGLFPLQLPA